MRKNPIWLAFLILGLVLTGNAWAQGLPSATLSGKVINEGQGLPGVSVAVKSPNLQGTRTTVTSGNGDYTFIALPPGRYTITFALSGFAPVTKQADLAGSQSSVLNATISLTAVAAEATVVGRAENISETTQAATTYTSDILNKLPVTRTLLSAVALAPGITQNGPNAAVTVSGAQSYDNLFLMNGANIMDNIRGTPLNLFIEDAIQETTTSTSGISAEYGRFAGGVINTITKAGGNSFSGSFRTNFSNPAWIAIQPGGTAGLQAVQETYEATLGGPIVKDMLWAFLAGRYAKTSTTYTTPVTSIGVNQGNEEKRYEGKLTFTPFQNQTLTASYLGIKLKASNYYFTPIPVYDLDSFYDRETPNNFTVLNYNGVITSNLFVEAQFSQKHFTFIGSGSKYTDLIKGTVIFDQAPYYTYNSPIFCAVCPGGDEKRDNNDYFAKATYFLSTPSMGSHNIVVGYDRYTNSRLSNNYQSGSGYSFFATDSQFAGTNVYPQVVPDSSYLSFSPILKQAIPTDLRSDSIFVNDSWKLGNQLTINLGLRYDKNHALDSEGNLRQNDSTWSPRLGVTFDPKGDGKVRFGATYGRYASGAQQVFAGSAGSAGGLPNYLYYNWNGPEINTGAAPWVSAHDVLARVFQWFGVPGPYQYPTLNTDQLFNPIIQGLNQGIASGMVSPHTDEVSVGISGSPMSRLTYRVDGIYRKAGGFTGKFIDTSTGQVSDSFGKKYDFALLNNSDAYERLYYGLNSQFSFRAMDGLTLGGNWTWSHTYGNLEGENPGGGPVAGGLNVYPEYVQASWNAPSGDLLQDQRHRVRIFASYDFPMPKAAGSLGLSGIFQYNTGTAYSASSTISVSGYVTNPGYITPPSRETYFFGGRGSYKMPSNDRLDLALNYSKDIGPVQLFIQPQVLNAFNAEHAIAVNSTVYTSNSRSSLTKFNPYTTDPSKLIECPATSSAADCKAMGANWQKSTSFGTPTSAASYQLPRTFQFSVGLRF